VLGSAAPSPIRAKDAEKMLVGEKISPNLLKQVAKKAAEEADPVADIHASEEYRRGLVNTLTKRTVKKAWDQAKAQAK
jgi:carbon-monoxide dehydrogenase medium subunit